MYVVVVVVQSLSHVRRFATPWTAAHQASLSFTVSQSLLKLMFIESVMPSNHLCVCVRVCVANTQATRCEEPFHWRVFLLEKTLMLGKIEGKRRRGWQRMR